MKDDLKAENNLVTRGYSLPRDIFDQLVSEAERQQRNTSNMLAVILSDYFTRVEVERELARRTPTVQQGA